MIFGSLALVAAGLTLLLPETHGLPLPDTLNDTEIIQASQENTTPLNKKEVKVMDETVSGLDKV